MNKLILIFTIFIFSGSFACVYAADKNKKEPKDSSQVITIETATIRGNQELPTVLYLVPWQPPEINGLNATQTADLTQNTIELIDRNSFTRLIKYHQDKIYPDSSD